MTATVHHGDNREWLATLDDDSFDVLTSDPPFAEETHKGARSVNDTHAELLTFDCISLPILRDTLALITDGSGAVLDPWCGEGKYGVAAVERGLGYAGCDIDPVMVQIARDALSATSAQPDLFTRTKPKQGALEL